MTPRQIPLSITRKYTVSELNKETKYLLVNHFSSIQVEGEISNLSTPSSGHIYFSLKDKQAQIRCAMFKSQQSFLDLKPSNGQQVILSAQVSLYETRGDYQLLVHKIQIDGDGDLQKAFAQLKAKLLNEGLFAPEKKQALPKIPQQIGIITSPSGAAIRDILAVLKRRFPSIPLIIYATAVQGESAKFEIVNAIKAANKITKQAKVDLIILARGGGSLEDLWAFNEECVARAIADSAIPIITGIGHEIDFTIADFVADFRAPTPSAAAESAVPNQQSWLHKFQSIETQLQKIIQRRLAHVQHITDGLTKRLQQQHLEQQLQRHAQTLDNHEMRLIRAITTQITQHKRQIDEQTRLLWHYNPSLKISRHQKQLHNLRNRLNIIINHQLKTSQNKYSTLLHTLNAVSPLATLERGYAIVSIVNSSSVVTSCRQVSVKDNIKTRFNQGHIISQVTKVSDV